MRRSDIYIGQIGIVTDINNFGIEKTLGLYQSVCPLYKIDDKNYINFEWIYNPKRKLRVY